MGWNCSTCTFRNLSDGSKTCLMCDSPRERKKAISATNDTKVAVNKKRTASASTQSTLDGKRVKDENNGSKTNGTRPSGNMKRAASTQSTLDGGRVPLKDEKITKKAKGAVGETISTISNNYKPIENFTYEYRSKRSQEVMKTVFGISQLRKNQQPTIECALKGQSQIVVMATGGGKSLCYQLPAVVIGGVTIVISPLIALMHDQVDALVKKGVAAACINSSNKESENNLFLDRVVGKRLFSKSSNSVLSPINILYVTPESLQTSKFQGVLKELEKQRRLAFFAVDESHCISSWGHDFRPAYRKLDCIAKYSNVPRMALTATATPKVLQDIKEQLKLEGASCHMGSFDRPNIFYKVHYKDGLDALEPGGALGDMVTFIAKQHKRAKKSGDACTGIVYVHKRDDCTRLASEITKRTGIPAAGYHGGMKNVDRTRIQREWISGKVQIAVATVALGMGIDLGHVRYVVHFTMPKTMDGFYQESGRAGRDGLPAISLVYFSRDDARYFSYIIRKQTENRKSKGNYSSLEREQEALQKVVDYCATPHCRRQFVLKHFGEKETDPKTVCDKSCDYCANPERIERAIQSADSMRAMAKQKDDLRKKGKAKEEWDGQWAAPHGDDLYIDNDEWEVDGLGVTGSAKAEPKFVGSAAFVSAKTLASKLSSLEAMEMQENESNGFYKFKSTKPRDHFPEHFKQQLQKAPPSTSSTAKPKSAERSSTEIAASAEKLKAELAAIKAQHEALLAKAKKK